MKQGTAERRRGRRITLHAPLLLRSDGQPSSQHNTSNISLVGAYFEIEAPGALALNSQVMASVAIPEADRRTFPFTRLAGRGRVVRIDELPPQDGSPRYGVALEFSNDLTALTAVPPWG
jgi:hypothetical protein